ncbi:unnamed protein product [Rotaria socialis]
MSVTSRFVAIDASLKNVSPIHGYESESLVSIEEALKDVESLINDLPSRIKVAREKCHFPSEHGLTQDESASIYIYTMEWGNSSLYRVLNKALRSKKRQALKTWFPYLKLFDVALNKLPGAKEVVWRGVPLDIGKDFIKNQTLTWWSINSCSSSVDVIKGFLGVDKKSTLFLIETCNGRKISGYTAHADEDEMILPIGSKFRVKSNSLDQSYGSHVVHLIEIDDKIDQSGALVMNQMKSNAIPPCKNSLGKSFILMFHETTGHWLSVWIIKVPRSKFRLDPENCSNNFHDLIEQFVRSISAQVRVQLVLENLHRGWKLHY